MSIFKEIETNKRNIVLNIATYYNTTNTDQIQTYISRIYHCFYEESFIENILRLANLI